jgi:putative ABC transport system ATP-binding protein
MQSAIELSHAKYDTAHWLESVGGSNGFYKSGRHVSYAMQRSEALTARYVAAHARHFRFNFMQTGLYLGLYAVASAALLGLGGWLVIQGQLSLGQLVAAELILSSTFYGVSQLGSYLDVFYDLVAGLEELHRLYDIPQESAPIVKADPGPIGVGGLTFRGVQAQGARFDIAIEGGARITAVAEPHVERMFSDLLKRHLKPSVGIITLGGSDLGALDIYRLRSEVIVLDRPVIVESTIRNYLSLAAPEAPPDAILDALRAVGLERRVTRLLGGLDMPLSSSGWPLSLPEMMRLKLAGALLARPRVLVLSPIYDMLPPKELAGVADRLGPETILIAFTRRPRELALGEYLHIASSGQTFVASADDLEKLDGAEEVERAVSS